MFFYEIFGVLAIWHEVNESRMEYLLHKSDISGSSHLPDFIRPPAECDEMQYTIYNIQAV